MLKIIGFEGTMTDSDIVSYGAAAIETADGAIVNSFTDLALPATNNDSSESITRLNTPWEIPESIVHTNGLSVVCIRTYPNEWTRLLLPDNVTAGVIKTKRAKPFAYVFFRNRESLDAFIEASATACVDSLLREEFPQATREIVHAGLVLSPTNPHLLAWRTFISEDPTRSEVVVSKLLNSHPARFERFKLFLRGLRAAATPKPEKLYFLKYEEGDQRIGGINVDSAVRQLNHIESINNQLAPTLRQVAPFLEEDEKPPEPRFEYLRAASAEFGFGVNGNSLRERVLRYLQLETLGNILRGHIPDQLRNNPGFMSDVKGLLNPQGGASLTHKPLDSSAAEPPSIDFPTEVGDSRIATTPISTIGFVQGFYNEISKAELRLGSSKISVSITQDDRGNPVGGVQSLRRGAGLFIPSVLKLVRERFRSGTCKYYLREILPLEKIELVDTLPSSILEGGLFMPKRSRVTQALALIPSPLSEPTFAAATDWLRSWIRRLTDIELESARDSGGTWFGQSSASHLEQLLDALYELDVPKEVAVVAKAINQKFDRHTRPRNVRRLITLFPDLFSETEKEEAELIGLSPRGASWFEALRLFRTQEK